MKKLLALLITVVMLFSAFGLSVSAEEIEVTDDFLGAVRLDYNNLEIQKEDIHIEYMVAFPYSSEKYLVKYSVDGYAYSCDMVNIGLGNYIITTDRPTPVVYFNGKMFELEDAYDNYILTDRDLEYLYSEQLIDIEKTKITYDLQCEVRHFEDDEFVNVMFELEGSDRNLSDYDNWIDDVHGTIEKLDAYFEELHLILLEDVLADFEYVDKAHNNGISVVAVKKSDVEEISQYGFVKLMDYVSDVHMRYIETYKPYFKEYTYKEKFYGCDENFEPTYVLVNAHRNMGATAVVGFRFGDVIVRSESIYGSFTYKYGVYDIKEDKFYDLFDLRETPDKYYILQDALYTFAGAIKVGDSDRDGQISVLDATEIQMCLAQINRYKDDEYYCSHADGESGWVSDYDNDGQISVLDATAIQLKLAGLDG